jgi:large subunit ribosomal protein L30
VKKIDRNIQSRSPNVKCIRKFVTPSRLASRVSRAQTLTAMSLAVFRRQSAACVRPWLLSTPSRALATEASQAGAVEPSTSTLPESNTHFKITLRRSAISLQENIKGTLVALGLKRRHQTVYQRHTPEAAGMILMVKELVEVENVPASAVRTQHEQTMERKASRGYAVTGSAVGDSVLGL